MKKNNIILAGLVVLALAMVAAAKPIFAKKKKLLVFTKTAGFRHGSIIPGRVAILKLGAENKFDVDTTADATQFSSSNLKQYDAVLFLNTTGDVLNDEQQSAFEQYIKDGGGFMGIHAATDCEYNWKWYGNLVGAYFGGHPAPQEAVLNITDGKHLSTKHLPATWKRKDEWYNYKWIAEDLHVLITIDENSYKGGKNSPTHPMAWYHEVDGGRSFYTALGHTDESFSEPLYLQHILGGIKYVMKIKK